jgi:phage-related protein
VYLKSVRFLGDSLKVIRDFGDDARRDAGFQLDRVQRGLDPSDFKPMPSIGRVVFKRFDCGMRRALIV